MPHTGAISSRRAQSWDYAIPGCTALEYLAQGVYPMTPCVDDSICLPDPVVTEVIAPAGRGGGSGLSRDYRAFCNVDPALLDNAEMASLLSDEVSAGEKHTRTPRESCTTSASASCPSHSPVSAPRAPASPPQAPASSGRAPTLTEPTATLNTPPQNPGHPSARTTSGSPKPGSRVTRVRLTPGTRVGPYEVLSALGSGGMAEVYRARTTRLGRDIAIRWSPRHWSPTPS
jgi:hypothetical protein